MIKKFRIIREDHNCGFFSCLIGALKEIKNAKLKGEIPIVIWGKDSLYYELGYGENAWEYYFNPVSCFGLKDIRFYHSKRMVRGAGWFEFELDDGKDLRQTICRCWAEYVSIKPHILEKIENFYKQRIQGNCVLGVHIRNTDRKSDQWLISQGGGFVGVEPYAAHIRKYISLCKTDRIFVASDEQGIVDRISAEFGESVILYSAERSTTGSSIHSDTSNFKSPYKKGEDVLIESVLLSKCNFLIRGTSNVSSVSLCMNQGLNFWDLNALMNNCALESWLGASCLAV